ncbi:hypothetical protein GFK90_01130 [Roseibium aggregatum]|nr:hypothetical protein GFK90_01130 [Roseibium aggregatum]
MTAAGRRPKHRLFTQPIPKDRQKEQFKRFVNLRVDSSRVVPFPNGGFLAILTEATNEIVLLCAPSLNDVEKTELIDWCSSELEVNEIEFDETMLLVSVKELPNLLRLKSKYREVELAQDIIGLADLDDYKGHIIYDIQSYFNDVIAFTLSPDNKFHGQGVSTVSLRLFSAQPNLISPIIESDIGDKIVSLQGKCGCDDSNLFQSLTASQWRYVYLDLYRCMESLFHFPWMQKLKSEMNLTVGFAELRDTCRSSLEWNSKEDKSIRKLFEFVDGPDLDSAKSKVSLFSNINAATATPGAYAKKVYEARNMLVHYEDRSRSDILPPSANEYKELCIFLCELLTIFDDRYRLDYLT